jgi:hypothetical protein
MWVAGFSETLVTACKIHGVATQKTILTAVLFTFGILGASCVCVCNNLLLVVVVDLKAHQLLRLFAP